MHPELNKRQYKIKKTQHNSYILVIYYTISQVMLSRITVCLPGIPFQPVFKSFIRLFDTVFITIPASLAYYQPSQKSKNNLSKSALIIAKKRYGAFYFNEDCYPIIRLILRLVFSPPIQITTEWRRSLADLVMWQAEALFDWSVGRCKTWTKVFVRIEDITATKKF